MRVVVFGAGRPECDLDGGYRGVFFVPLTCPAGLSGYFGWGSGLAAWAC